MFIGSSALIAILVREADADDLTARLEQAINQTGQDFALTDIAVA